MAAKTNSWSVKLNKIPDISILVSSSEAANTTWLNACFKSSLLTTVLFSLATSGIKGNSDASSPLILVSCLLVLITN